MLIESFNAFMETYLNEGTWTPEQKDAWRKFKASGIGTIEAKTRVKADIKKGHLKLGLARPRPGQGRGMNYVGGIDQTPRGVMASIRRDRNFQTARLQKAVGPIETGQVQQALVHNDMRQDAMAATKGNVGAANRYYIDRVTAFRRLKEHLSDAPNRPEPNDRFERARDTLDTLTRTRQERRRYDALSGSMGRMNAFISRFGHDAAPFTPDQYNGVDAEMRKLDTIKASRAKFPSVVKHKERIDRMQSQHDMGAPKHMITWRKRVVKLKTYDNQGKPAFIHRDLQEPKNRKPAPGEIDPSREVAGYNVGSGEFES